MLSSLGRADAIFLHTSMETFLLARIRSSHAATACIKLNGSLGDELLNDCNFLCACVRVCARVYMCVHVCEAQAHMCACVHLKCNATQTAVLRA